MLSKTISTETRAYCRSCGRILAVRGLAPVWIFSMCKIGCNAINFNSTNDISHIDVYDIFVVGINMFLFILNVFYLFVMTIHIQLNRVDN